MKFFIDDLYGDEDEDILDIILIEED